MLASRYLRYFDWISFGLMLILMSIGLLFVYSATYRPEQPYSYYFYKQLFGIGTGLIIYVLCIIIDYRTLQRWSYFCFYFTIGLLLFTLIKGSFAMGAHRWINLGFTKFQPSELAKLFFPGFFAYHLESAKNYIFTHYTFIPICGILCISSPLILKQPDLGTTLIILFSAAVLLWLAGLSKKIFLIGILLLCVSTPITWKLLRPYQKKRILVFLGEGDIRKDRYHIEQSQIAIGSGGISGKGFLRGTQNTLKFLPESRTDSIFSVICEEWGFLGALAVLILYCLLFIHILLLMSSIKNFYTQLLAIGLILHIIISTIINVGMIIGLLPMVGIPLPLISYGITNMWITLASLGWINGIVIRRQFINLTTT